VDSLVVSGPAADGAVVGLGVTGPLASHMSVQTPQTKPLLQIRSTQSVVDDRLLVITITINLERNTSFYKKKIKKKGARKNTYPLGLPAALGWLGILLLLLLTWLLVIHHRHSFLLLRRASWDIVDEIRC